MQKLDNEGSPELAGNIIPTSPVLLGKYVDFDWW